MRPDNTNWQRARAGCTYRDPAHAAVMSLLFEINECGIIFISKTSGGAMEITGKSGWRTEQCGPWTRYRRILPGGRWLIVAPGLCGGWTWDLWGVAGDEPLWLEMPDDSFADPQEAMRDAGHAAEVAAVPDVTLASKLGVDPFRGPVSLKPAPVGDHGGMCSACTNDIAAGTLAAAEIGSNPWWWCASCATRNPGAFMVTSSVAAG
jgi:hypothetical protein